MVEEVELVEVVVVDVVIKEVVVVAVEEVVQGVVEGVVVALRPMLSPRRVVLRSLLLPQGMSYLSH
jgi:hypothetical protein